MEILSLQLIDFGLKVSINSYPNFQAANLENADFLVILLFSLMSPLSIHLEIEVEIEREINISYWFCFSGEPWLILSSVAQLCPTLCSPMVCSIPGFPVHHQLPELAQTHVHWVSDTIQPSHPLPSSPSPPTFSLSQHQGLLQWVDSSYQVDKVLELQLQHQSFSWIFRTNFL